MKKQLAIFSALGMAAGLSACGNEKGVYPMTPAQLKAALENASVTYQEKAGGIEQSVYGEGVPGSKVRVFFSNSHREDITRSCLISFEPVDGSNTKVLADCTEGEEISAQEKTRRDFDRAAALEFVDSQLAKRPFDYKSLRLKNAAAVGKNLGAMQKEALEMHDRIDAASADAADPWADTGSGWEAEGGWGSE